MIGYNLHGNSESSTDILIHKLSYIFGFNRGSCRNFYPLCHVVNSHQNKLFTMLSFRKRSYCINSPFLEWSKHHNRLQRTTLQISYSCFASQDLHQSCTSLWIVGHVKPISNIFLIIISWAKCPPQTSSCNLKSVSISLFCQELFVKIHLSLCCTKLHPPNDIVKPLPPNTFFEKH